MREGNNYVHVITFGLRPTAEQLGGKKVVGKKVDSPFFPGGPS